jgi:hypothetical protein
MSGQKNGRKVLKSDRPPPSATRRCSLRSNITWSALVYVRLWTATILLFFQTYIHEHRGKLSLYDGSDSTLVNYTIKYPNAMHAPKLTFKLQMAGKFQWEMSKSDVFDMCGGISSNETELLLEAAVTNVENGQLVRAQATTILHKENLRMGFSLPSPAVLHPDMPFLAWVITPNHLFVYLFTYKIYSYA